MLDSERFPTVPTGMPQVSGVVLMFTFRFPDRVPAELSQASGTNRSARLHRHCRQTE